MLYLSYSLGGVFVQSNIVINDLKSETIDGKVMMYVDPSSTAGHLETNSLIGSWSLPWLIKMSLDITLCNYKMLSREPNLFATFTA